MSVYRLREIQWRDYRIPLNKCFGGAKATKILKWAIKFRDTTMKGDTINGFGL